MCASLLSVCVPPSARAHVAVCVCVCGLTLLCVHDGYTYLSRQASALCVCVCVCVCVQAFAQLLEGVRYALQSQAHRIAELEAENLAYQRYTHTHTHTHTGVLAYLWARVSAAHVLRACGYRSRPRAARFDHCSRCTLCSCVQCHAHAEAAAGQALAPAGRTWLSQLLSCSCGRSSSSVPPRWPSTAPTGKHDHCRPVVMLSCLMFV